MGIEIPTKIIIDVEQCYPVTRTVCTESVSVIDNEICTYSYQQKTEATTAKTVEVPYTEPIKTCVNKPINLIVISCEDLTAEKCIIVPEVMDDIEVEEKCITQLAAPACQTVEL